MGGKKEKKKNKQRERKQQNIYQKEIKVPVREKLALNDCLCACITSNLESVPKLLKLFFAP